MTTPHQSAAICDRRAELVAYLYGEVTPAEAASFERHLQTCPVCRAELDGLQTVRTALQSWEMDAVAPRLQLVIRPTVWQAWREFFALLPRWGKLATGAAAVVLVISLANVQITIGPHGVLLSTGWLTNSETAHGLRAPAVTPTASGAALSQTPTLPDDTVLQHAAARLVAEMVATQSQARDAALEARIKAILDARLKQQRAELVQLVNQLNREQRLQLATWIRESEQRASPDLLDLVSNFSMVEGDE
jgi:hypothetical protein